VFAAASHWKLELVALRHQVTVLRQQRPGQLRLFSTDRLLWVWLYRVVTAPQSPWQNAYVERLICSIRRECLDHIIISNEHHLREVLSSYFQYYHKTRTHLSPNKDCK
jgi:hypothetical protein